MRGVGGPLLTIGDLLADIGDGGAVAGDVVEPPLASSPVAAAVAEEEALSPSDLHRLFEEYYDELMKALERNDHSWTSLMLKLCTALKTAEKLVSCANSNVEFLLEKVAVLESILERGDRAVATLKDVQYTQLAKDQSSKAPKKL